MKRLIITLIVLFVGTNCFALNFNKMNTIYTQSALQRAKYYPQNSYSKRYRRQPNYIFTPQQARYYGYRTPQLYGTYNSYYGRRY